MEGGASVIPAASDLDTGGAIHVVSGFVDTGGTPAAVLAFGAGSAYDEQLRSRHIARGLAVAGEGRKARSRRREHVEDRIEGRRDGGVWLSVEHVEWVFCHVFRTSELSQQRGAEMLWKQLHNFASVFF